MKINSKAVIQLRTKKLWSQHQLAKAAGLSLRTIQRVEKESSASLETVKALAATLEIDSDSLIGEERSIEVKKSPMRKRALLFFALVISLTTSLFITTATNASLSIEISSDSVSVDREKNSVRYTGSVEVLIPNEVVFKLSKLNQRSFNEMSQDYQWIVQLEQGSLLLSDPSLSNSKSGLKIDASDANWFHEPTWQ